MKGESFSLPYLDRESLMKIVIPALHDNACLKLPFKARYEIRINIPSLFKMFDVAYWYHSDSLPDNIDVTNEFKYVKTEGYYFYGRYRVYK